MVGVLWLCAEAAEHFGPKPNKGCARFADELSFDGPVTAHKQAVLWVLAAAVAAAAVAAAAADEEGTGKKSATD